MTDGEHPQEALILRLRFELDIRIKKGPKQGGTKGKGTSEGPKKATAGQNRPRGPKEAHAKRASRKGGERGEARPREPYGTQRTTVNHWVGHASSQASLNRDDEWLPRAQWPSLGQGLLRGASVGGCQKTLF